MPAACYPLNLVAKWRRRRDENETTEKKSCKCIPKNALNTRDWEMKKNALFCFIICDYYYYRRWKGKHKYWRLLLQPTSITIHHVHAPSTISFWQSFFDKNIHLISFMFVVRKTCIGLSVINVMIGLICSVLIWLCKFCMYRDREWASKQAREKNRREKHNHFGLLCTNAYAANRYAANRSINDKPLLSAYYLPPKLNKFEHEASHVAH